MKTDHLIGRKFIHGSADCYGLVRDFYRDNFGVQLRNYARPDDHWDAGHNLYMDCFFDEGFRVLHCHPLEWRPGDAILMAIRSPVANHAGVFIEGGQVLHHLWGRFSIVEPYAGLLRNTTVAVLRHKDVNYTVTPTQLDLMEIIPDALQRRLASALPGRNEGAGGIDSLRREDSRA